MHETSIAMAIHGSAREAVAHLGPGRLETVKVAVGELSAVEPELLRFAWEAVVAGGPDQTARLEIEWRTATQYCVRCRRPASRPRGTWLRLCERCSEPLRIEGGDELDVLQVAFLTDDEAREGDSP